MFTATEPPRGADAARSASSTRACAWCGLPFDAGARRLADRVVCGSCGAQTTDPQPTDDELERAYASWYRPESGRFSGFGDRLLRRLRARLASRLVRIAPPGPVLDVGAGDGALLDALAARGRPALGLERHSERDDVLARELDDVEGEWAAVVFWHSLEHLRDAGQALDRAASLLGPGGVIVIAIPNAASVQAAVFGDRWLALDLPRHLVHVPASALLARLAQLGLRVERVSHVRGGQVVFGWLHGFVGALPGELDLYDTIRRPGARRAQVSLARRLAALSAAALLVPIAVSCALAEAARRRGGTVYVEARRG